MEKIELEYDNEYRVVPMWIPISQNPRVYTEEHNALAYYDENRKIVCHKILSPKFKPYIE